MSSVLEPHVPIVLDPKGPAVVATHGHCFDGVASAVLFSHLLKQVEPKVASRFLYRGQAYDPGKNGVDPSIFQGASATAILDFRYTKTNALTWYFDHHVSAFPTESERAHFENLAMNKRGFYDAQCTSCTKLIDSTAREIFGINTSAFAELIRWADVIDSAAFPSPQIAVERSEPEMRLLSVIEQQGDDALLTQLVQSLLHQPLHEVAQSQEILRRYTPIDALHRVQVARIRSHAQEKDAVIFVDLLDTSTETVTKFVTYADYPKIPYSVVASRTDRRCKISVGYNPWSGIHRTHDIAKICERYGGGGHPVVGAIALPFDIETCRRIALEIVDELNLRRYPKEHD